MNSRFATGHFFANLPLSKFFLVQNYKWGFVSFKKTGFFAHFLTFKNYKNIERIALILFKQARTEYCITKHI